MIKKRIIICSIIHKLFPNIFTVKMDLLLVTKEKANEFVVLINNKIKENTCFYSSACAESVIRSLNDFPNTLSLRISKDQVVGKKNSSINY